MDVKNKIIKYLGGYTTDEYKAVENQSQSLSNTCKVYKKLAEKNMEGWEKSSDSKGEIIAGWDKTIQMAKELGEQNTRMIKHCEEYESLIKEYYTELESLHKTIDSLVGELILLGVNEEEIPDMFDDKTGANSYNAIMNELHKNKDEK